MNFLGDENVDRMLALMKRRPEMFGDYTPEAYEEW